MDIMRNRNDKDWHQEDVKMNTLNAISSQNNKKHFAVMDGWRFWAALSIWIHHSIYFAYFSAPKKSGFILVCLSMPFFFMLSGFLAAASVKEDMQWDFFSCINYYIRRLIRIYPQHILALLVFFLLFKSYENFSPDVFTANLLLEPISKRFGSSC